MSPSTGPDSPDQQVSAVARNWVVRLASGHITAAELRRLKAWLAEHPSHQEAFDRERAFWQQLEPLREAVPEAGDHETLTRGRERPRRGWHVVIGGMVAASLAGIVFYQDIRLLLSADHRTSTGQQLVLTLPDGGIAHLNTDSAITVSYTEHERRIELLKGEALFDVVPNQEAPFRVVTQGGITQAVGTAFVVRAQDEQTRVTVVEGVVAVSALDSHGRQTGPAVPVRKDQQTAYRPGAAPEDATSVDSRAVTAWTRGAIQIQGEPFATAISELNRYRPGRIVVLADLSRTKPVSGRFTLAGIDDAVTALAQTQGLRVVRVTDYLIFIF